MSYRQPDHVGVYVEEGAADLRVVAATVKAFGKLMREQVAPMWGLPPAGIELYDEPGAIDRAEALPILIARSDGNPESLGWHAHLGGVVETYMNPEWQGTLFHEYTEAWRNQHLGEMATMPNGTQVFVEIADMDQRGYFDLAETVLGKSENVMAVNVASPAWFGLETSAKYDLRGSLHAPWHIARGGYMPAIKDGQFVYLPPSDASTFAAGIVEHGRTNRMRRAWSAARKPAA